jgi:hypothetical protein
VSNDVSEQQLIPLAYGLEQNYPNPFNPSTIIRYHLPIAGHVKLVLYDVLGRKVMELVDDRKVSGSHEVKVDAGGLASGVYMYRLEVHGHNSGIPRGAGGAPVDFVQVRRMIILK